jgi:trehalose 6-phosphate phosphatase
MWWGSVMEFTAELGEQRYAALVRAAAETVVGLDFDGTLAPIVEDPSEAHIHPDAGQVLVDLADQVLAIAVVTGRPARQALDLGGLDRVGNAIGDRGKELYLFGQYGNERWNSTNRRVISPRPPPGLASFTAELPRLLRRQDAEDAHIEEKGLAVAVHTRRLADAGRTFETLLPAIEELAGRYDLMVEPGKQVIEVRSPGMHKGIVVEKLVDELHAGGFVFVGDDLGDVEAFEAVAAKAQHGLPTLLVCSDSDEESGLARLSDVLVDGPEGVLDLLRQFTADAAALRA